MTNLIPISAFSDNYIWLIINQDKQKCAIIDPGEANPVLKYIDKNSLTPDAILITHHHDDHTDGIKGILNKFSIPVYGSKYSPIGYVDNHMQEGNLINLSDIGIELTVIETPGHTNDHISFFGNGMLFCGDALFAAGCGKVFEGTMAEMLNSLNKFKRLHDDTLVCCAHEYTLKNLAFAQAVTPNNPIIQERINECQQLQKQNTPTLPSTIGLEKLSNPFLRCTDPEIIEAACKHSGKKASQINEVEIFSILRKWKDGF